MKEEETRYQVDCSRILKYPLNAAKHYTLTNIKTLVTIGTMTYLEGLFDQLLSVFEKNPLPSKLQPVIFEEGDRKRLRRLQRELRKKLDQIPPVWLDRLSIQEE